MPDYRYVAIDAQGRERKGRLTAANDDAARADLIRRKFHIVAVEAAGAKPAGRSLFAFRRNKLSNKDLALFTRQLATLAEVAPLEEALRTLTRQSEAETARAVIGDVHAGLLEGRRLADAMARQPGSFPPLYRAMVAAGETTGSLTTILARLADLLERQAEVRGKLIAALAYPIVLAIVAIGVVAALM
ncbi:type II secretion system F family protein, partial [Sphingopyxis sp. RIFCSPHIGHO2_12_FULL_65_19]|uniref:type II secretion system F family protein n=1 Tax=Sphingopyxis sp. RIFCSPHIGHO2_12_FULL_65_19 TaxID=1802172 RepID=UPI0025DF14AC